MEDGDKMSKSQDSMHTMAQVLGDSDMTGKNCPKKWANLMSIYDENKNRGKNEVTHLRILKTWLHTAAESHNAL